MAGCSELLSGFLSAGCRGALGTAGGSAVLGSLPSADAASSQTPVVVCSASLPVFICSLIQVIVRYCASHHLLILE